MEQVFGLIGRSLGHSFSQKYFSEKFSQLGLNGYRYELFELAEIQELNQMLAKEPNLRGFNVTIPYKQAIIPFLDALAPSAQAVGAVNTVKVEAGKLLGHNTDLYGFERSFQESLLGINASEKAPFALILGNGGAAQAVKAALDNLHWQYQVVSRRAQGAILSYEHLSSKRISQAQAIINTTPLGMQPNTDTAPPIDYQAVSPPCLAFDLVYNPLETKFMQLAQKEKALVKNGLDMLYYQANRAWEIWQQSP